MPTVAGPFTLTPGTPVVIRPPGIAGSVTVAPQAGIPPMRCLLQNLSTYPCVVITDRAAGDWLAPYQARMVELSGTAINVTVTPQSVPNVIGGQVSSLLATFYDEGEAAPPLSAAFPLTVPPVVTRDLWFWPCIQGEDFPPSFVNSAGYGSAVDNPSVFANVGGATTAADAVWPNLPRVGSLGQQTITITGRLLFAWSQTDVELDFQVNQPGGSGNGPPYTNIRVLGGTTAQVQVRSNAYGNTIVAVPIPTQNTWYAFRQVIYPDGTIDITWNGTKYISKAASEWVPGSVAVSMTLLASCGVAGHVGEIDATGLQVAYS